jgi:hypothetical protein
VPYLTLAQAEALYPKLETALFNRPVSWRVTEVLSASAWQALMESVDYWPMAIIIRKTLGGKLKPVAASGRDWWKVSSS